MFDDLINKKGNRSSTTDHILADNECPSCGSKNVEIDYGVFISACKYSQYMVCKDCGLEWKVIYDKQLHIIDVEIQ